MSPWLLFHKFNNSKYYSHTINYCLLYYITYTIMMVFCLFFLYEKVCFHAIRYFFSDLITNICITMFTCLLWTVYIIAFCRWWIWLQLLLPWWSSLVLTIHFNIWSLILPKDFAFLLFIQTLIRSSQTNFACHYNFVISNTETDVLGILHVNTFSILSIILALVITSHFAWLFNVMLDISKLLSEIGFIVKFLLCILVAVTLSYFIWKHITLVLVCVVVLTCTAASVQLP